LQATWVRKVSPVLLKQEFRENAEQPCRLIVEMASPQTARLAAYVEANAGQVCRCLKVAPFMVVELPYQVMPAIARSPHVRKVWHDTKVSTMLDVAVPLVGGAKAQGMGLTGKDVTVAIIDTGISPHPDLLYPESRIVGWHDLVKNQTIPYDDNGHGTHIAGIIAGNGVLSQGRYRGMAPEAKLLGIKALDREGAGNTSDVIAALEWCLANQKEYHIKVINISLGSAAQSSYQEDPLCRAVEAAWRQGIVVCVAAGNDGPKARTINTPGITPGAITVGNLDDHDTADLNDDQLSESSSRGPTIDQLVKPDILAPGTNITSLRVGWGYRTLTGTSMATPMVTGAAAQILQKWPSLRPEQVKSLLIRNARELGLESNFGGYGAMQLDSIFAEESQKQRRQKSFLEWLFDAGLAWGRMFGGAALNHAGRKTEGSLSRVNPVSLLMLLPLILLG
jgi:serine protease AprX